MKKFGNVSLGNIQRVCTIKGDKSTYYCKIMFSDENTSEELVNYIARIDDMTETGKWVYQQITEGKFQGKIVDVQDGINVFTGETISDTSEHDVLMERGKRLSSTDWTQLPDVSESIKNKWAPYRQALRDITDQPGYPKDIVWPEQPE